MNVHPSKKKKKERKKDTVPLASPPEFTDASMPQASPASVPQDFPDGATASAMLLWAEDSDVPLDTARQAVQRVPACAIGCACLDSTFPHVSFGHHALGDNSTISLIFAWHGNLACQVASPDVCMAALLRIYAFRHTCVMT